ncbi:MAG: hypothetical protein AAGC93_08605 [Cyanobacteria bacterium P01_F01_bin.53]
MTSSLHPSNGLKTAPLVLINVGLSLMTLGAVLWQQHQRQNTAVLVQLSTGESIQAEPRDALYRSEASIQSFVRSTLGGLYTWPGYLPDNSGQLIVDQGQEIQTDSGVLRLPSRALVATYALSEDFQHPFRETLADMIPSAVYGGGVEAVLLIDQLSRPTTMTAGRWQVDVVANLKLVDTTTQKANYIPYNHRITVAAVDPAVMDPAATPHQQAMLRMRQSGLQITAIAPLTLEDLTHEP